ncbi:MAG TPA: IS1595 family transposase [Stellaceae bacterium]|nr:IS1595 family transposase [Stellaceae bacterium]
MSNEPRTLLEAIKHFAKPDVAHNLLVELRWPQGVFCPTCGRADIRYIATRRLWECKEKHPKRQFSARVGTIFEDSPLGLDKWFAGIWMVANCKNGISSYEMARDLGITQKSAWFLDHRIRLAMKAGSIMKADGEFEADESFIGGLSKNMHKSKRRRVIKGTGGTNKTAVLGILRRKDNKHGSRVKAKIIPNVKATTLQLYIRNTLAPGATINTDAWVGYRGLQGDFGHQVIDHAYEYVRGQVHTNGIENFWSLLKRTIKGTYISVEPFHLGAYLDEQAFRFNERDDDDYGRFKKVLSSVFGKRLTYSELTGNGQAPNA